MPKAGVQTTVKLNDEEVQEWVDRRNEFIRELAQEFIDRLSNADPSKFEWNVMGVIEDMSDIPTSDDVLSPVIHGVYIEGWLNE